MLSCAAYCPMHMQAYLKKKRWIEISHVDMVQWPIGSIQYVHDVKETWKGILIFQIIVIKSYTKECLYFEVCLVMQAALSSGAGQQVWTMAHFWAKGLMKKVVR